MLIRSYVGVGRCGNDWTFLGNVARTVRIWFIPHARCRYTQHTATHVTIVCLRPPGVVPGLPLPYGSAYSPSRAPLPGHGFPRPHLRIFCWLLPGLTAYPPPYPRFPRGSHRFTLPDALHWFSTTALHNTGWLVGLSRLR